MRVVAPGLADEVQHVNANLQIYRFSAPEQPLSTLSLFSVVDLLRILKVLRAGGKATRAAVSAGGTVHILALWALPCGYWAKSAGVRFSVPYSVWTLGSDIWSLGKIPVVRRILAGVLRNARRCYSDGYRLRDDTQRIAGRDVMFLPSTRNIALAVFILPLFLFSLGCSDSKASNSTVKKDETSMAPMPAKQPRLGKADP